MIFGIASLAVAGVVGWVVSVADSTPDIGQLKPLDEGSNSVVYTHDGKRLGFISSLILRRPVDDAAIPRSLKRATVAIEDKRFYQHTGIDYEGVVRAAVKNVTSGRTVQGGSTLTMQLVRNTYLPDERYSRDFKRKIREAKLAEELEKKRSKRWILDSYLNSVSYGTVGGQTAVGVEAAARMFFGKPAKKLTVAQSALLAGLPQAPSSDNPFLNPQGAYARRNEVLRAMVTAGYLSPARGAAAARSKLGVRPNRYFTARREQFFFDYVTRELMRRYGVRTVRQGGLKVYTTLDLKLQEQARKAIAGRLSVPGDPSSAIVSIDPANGRILAMASSASYGRTKFDYAAQAQRQPGSTFKVMILMAALSKGIDPSSTYYTSRPLAEGWLASAPTYSVSTYGHTYSGSLNLVQATLKSDNTVFAQLDADVTPEAVSDAAHKMGITSKLYGYPAEGLGGLTDGVSPLEMANAYATVASGGWRNTPTAVLRVVHPDGRVDDLGRPKRVKAFSDGITTEVTKILKENIQAGTGTAANIPCPAGGKTGTTSDYKDAWFVGFTPRMSTSVWVGYPNPPIPMTSVHGIEVAGGTFPAEIWHDFMLTAKGSYCGDFPPPTTPFSSSPFFGRFASTGRKATPDSSSGGYGAPSYGAPSYGAPSYGAPSSGTPSYGAPSYGTPPATPGTTTTPTSPSPVPTTPPPVPPPPPATPPAGTGTGGAGGSGGGGGGAGNPPPKH